MYLSGDIKAAVKRAARVRGTSEAEVIRESLRSALRADRPRPSIGFLRGEPIASRVDELLDGFGER